MKIVLASNSKWRRSIAEKALNLPVENSICGVNEKAIINEVKPNTPEEHVQAISKGKLKYFKDKSIDLIKQIKSGEKEENLILCYDTIVICENKILEKPINKEDLKRMINLWGKENSITYIYTGLSIGKLSNDDSDVHKVCKAKVKMLRDFTEEEYNKYISDKTVYTSSGGYIVEILLDLKIVELIEGSIDIIQGFPIEDTKSIISNIIK